MLRPEMPTWIVGDASYCVSPGLELDERGLRDADGEHFELNGTARLLCAIGERPTHVETVVEMLAVRTATPRAVVESHVHDFLVDLSARGLVSVHQSHLREGLEVLRALPWILSVALVDRRLAYRGRLPLRRYPATMRAVLVGTLEAHQLLCWVAVALALVMGGVLGAGSLDTLNVVQTSTAPQVMLGVLVFFLLLVVSLLAHEVGHFLMARATGCDAFTFYVRAGAAGLGFRAGSRRAHVTVALAGPLAALAVLLLVLAVGAVTPADVWLWLGVDQLRASMAGAIAVLCLYHLAALTPLGKDGRQLRRLARAQRRTGKEG